MKNWKTTAGAAGVALGTVASILTSIANGTFVLDAATISTLIAAASAVWGLVAAKDSNVTGGTVRQ